MRHFIHLRSLAIALILLGAPAITLSADIPPVEGSWRQLESVEDVVAAYPRRMRSLVDRLDLDRPGLETVRAAYEAGELAAAAEALLAYYREADSGAWLRSGPDEVGERGRQIADDAVADRFTQQGTTDRVPRDEGGHLEWTYRGPQDDRQFAVFVNRHQYFPSLVALWHVTGEDIYAATVDRLVRDWVTAYGTAPEKPKPIDVWTPLNPGIRMAGPWPRAFYGLQEAEVFTPAARLLLLYTVPQHAEFLQEHLWEGHNFATMQMNGLGTLGAAFPEFKQAGHWRTFAVEQTLREFELQVYPDGVQKELTASYHWVALRNFEQLARSLQKGGYEVPGKFQSRLEAM